METTLLSNSPENTISLGHTIGRQLRGGEIFGISGPLGSGKTHLIKGIATGAGAEDATRVTSPTFVLVNQYHGRLDIYHLDAYRLDSIAEFEMLGFDDLCTPESVVLIEWVDKVEQAICECNYGRIELSHTGERTRSIRLLDLPSYIRVR